MYYLGKVKFTEDVFSKSKGVTEKITTSQFLVAAESVSDAELKIHEHLKGAHNFEVSSVSESKIEAVIGKLAIKKEEEEKKEAKE